MTQEKPKPKAGSRTFMSLHVASLLIGLIGITALISSFYRGVQAEDPQEKVEAKTYVGTKECKKCHMKIYLGFRKSAKYKESWKQIADAPDKEKCYSCHTTGFGRPSGFVSLEATPELKGVGCESCHGPGSAHIAVARTAEKEKKAEDPATIVRINAAIERRVTRCVECHNLHIPDKAVEARKK